jgi:hypothetical protein
MLIFIREPVHHRTDPLSLDHSRIGLRLHENGPVMLALDAFYMRTNHRSG